MIITISQKKKMYSSEWKWTMIGLTGCSCWRINPFSFTSCETCFCSLSFSSINSLFIAESFLFTLWSWEASFLCFSLHLQNKKDTNQITQPKRAKPFHTTQIQNKQKKVNQNLHYLLFWNQTLICLGSMLARTGHSRISCCLLNELGLGHSTYTFSKASICSAVYLTYLPDESRCLSMLLSLCCCATAIAIFLISN